MQIARGVFGSQGYVEEVVYSLRSFLLSTLDQQGMREFSDFVLAV